MSETNPKFKVTIDGVEVEVDPGTTILNAARLIGGDVVPPAMCYYSSLEGSGGKCRTCLVEVSKSSEKDPRPMPKLVASCFTPVMDGMEVKNKSSEKVIDARAGVVEMLLINHPLDCPVCDQAGECDLQNLAYEHGKSTTRYEFERRTFDKVDIGEYIKLHMTRCILCYRCVYTANQLTDKREHGVLKRGDAAEIDMGITVEEFIYSDTYCGGMKNGKKLKACVPGGSSVPILPHYLVCKTAAGEDRLMSYESLSDGGFATGSMLGSGGFIVYDEDQCIVRNTWNFTRFYHHESCGQCSPCREGTGWMEKVLHRLEYGHGKMEDIDLLWDIQRKIEGNTICPLGDAAAWPVAAAIRHFREEFEWHVNEPKLCTTKNYGLVTEKKFEPVNA